MQLQNTALNQKVGIQSKVLFINSDFVKGETFPLLKVVGSGFLSLFPSSPLAHLAESRGWGSEVRGQTDLLPWLLTAALWATNAEGHTPLQAVSEASWRSPARPSGLGDASPLLTKAHFSPRSLRTHSSLRFSLMEFTGPPQHSFWTSNGP